MLSAVKTARNHYEVLGLAPTATQQEIAGAFTAAMGMFGGRPTAAAAQVCQAFAVLRSPAARKAYDRRIGLTPPSQLYAWPSTPAQQFVARVPIAATSGRDRPPAPESAPDARSPDQRAAEARLAELVASLRKLAEPAAKVEAEQVAVAKPTPSFSKPPAQRTAPESLEPLIEQMLAFERAQKDKPRAGDHGLPSWARPALAVGGLIVAAGVLGGALGMSAIAGPDTDPSVAVRLPAASPRPASPSAGPAVAASQAKSLGIEAVPAARTQGAPQRHRSLVAAKPPSVVAQDQLVEDKVAVEAEQASSETIAPDPLAPAPEPAALSGARMPLPSNVVARTIRRIGYRCDQVASTTAIADGPGAFLVTCSSGESYRASQVRGRYHFRRLASR